MSNEFDAAVAASLQPDKAQAARVGFSVASDSNPDTYAEAQRVARRTGVPVDTALNMPKEVKRQADIGSIDFDSLAKTSPVTASLLADVEKAKIAHDDVDNLSSVERTLLGTAGDAYATLIKGAIGLPQAFVGLADIPTFGYVGKGLDAIGIRFNDAQKAAEELFYSDAQKQAAKKVQSAQGFTDTLSAALHNPSVIATTAGESVPQILGGASIARGLLKFLPKASSVLLGAIGEGATGAGSAAESIRSQSVDGTLSFKQSLAAVGSGVGTAAFGLAGGKVAGRLGLDDIDAALVRAGLDKGVAKAAKIGFVSKLAAGGISEGLFEELPQSAQEQMWQNYATGKPLGDGVKNAMAMGLVTGGVMGGGFQGVHHALAKAQSAEQGAQQLAKLNELASDSKVLQRDPQSFEAFIEQVSEGGPVQQVFIDANTLMQSGVAEQVAAVSPAVATQLAEAVQTGGQIAIPVGEYAARIAPTEYAQSLLDHLKTEPDGFSRSEAQAYMQNHAEELQAEVERTLAEKQGDDTFKASAEVVKEQLLADLNTLSRFTPAKNEVDATIFASYYAVRAAQMGITPEKLFAKRRVRFNSERIDGLQFDQGEVQKTDQTDDITGLPLNEDGTVTVYHHTSAENAAKIRRDGWLRSAGEPDLYFTTQAETDTGYGDTAIAVRVKPERLQLDDEFPGGRQDYRVGSPTKGRRLRFLPDGSAVLNQGARGAFNPASLTIAMLKGADLTTVQHEGAHFFFDNDLALAAELAQEARIFGLDAINPGERQILADVSALLNWHGIQGGIDAQLSQWYGLDFKEKRAYHERTAESFEVYLFEGKAPSLELQPYFQKFRAWFLHVYSSLKDFLARNPEAGKLYEEVRGIFDRMLATNEQITLAEQGRSMMPLFTSPGQVGITPEEFAAYQALGVDATNDAIQNLQARGLRDMQWMRNARGRIIKQLQKEAKAQRAEVQMEIRREVMSQPIYRAWQFLTGKLTPDDKIAPVERSKSDPDVVEPALDSLFVAIAKLGGIQRESVSALWGVKPEDKPRSGVFGKPVLRRTGGLTVDQMAERLAELGYLEPDENGNTAIRDFEEAFHSELGGSPVYSREADYGAIEGIRAGDQVANPQALGAGRFDMGELRAMGFPTEVINAVQARRMTAANGLHPDIVAEMFGFTSGDELARKLAVVESPKDEIDALTDVRMLELFGDLTSPEAIEKAADKAIYNEARVRFVATEANALSEATGQRKVLASAAREFARAMIARLKVRDIKPGQYANAEVRAARAAKKASDSGDIATAAAEKRNQSIQIYATRAAYDAQENVDRGLRYLKKFDGDIKGLDAEYANQIGNLLERFDLRKGQSNKAIDKRTALAEWIKAQREAGLEPDIPPELENEAFRTSYKNMTVEEFQGLVDTVKQIEHLGRLKHKLLTAADQRAYEAVRDEIAASIHEHAQGRQADTRTPTTNMGRALQGLKRFWASHIKAATWARVMDGGKDGGPMWEYFVRSANERGDMETTMRAEATAKLSEILAPVFKLGKMGGKGQFFPTINRSLNREARIAIALNMGNDGNTQRLLGGEGWTIQQLTPVLQSLTAQEWQAVQAVWDHFESYRPQIAAKERRVYGKEPEWVEPRPFSVTTADGATVQMRGGYYPIKYDPAASQRAEEHSDAESAKRQLQGAYTTATTRRSFTKSRVKEVSGRPLLYTLSGLYSGVNDVIHDLAWHEWLIDTNRLLRSHTIDSAIRDHYGPEAKQQFKTWAQDIAEGEKGADGAVDLALSRLRQGISASGLGFNVMSAIMQPLGITQSITRVGAPWIGRGIAKYLGNPLGLTRTVHEMSDFMANRARTRFRELNELRNQVQDQSALKEMTGRYAYFLMMRCQQIVDVPTWWGAYEKAIAEGNEEARAIALADQAVIDAQGGGQTKDLSAIERGGPAQKLFTVFYSFMNTALQNGVVQTMSANTPAKRAKLAVDYAMLYVVPAVLGYFLKAALTPGDAGDDDPEKIAKKLAANQIDYLMGLMVVLREFSEAAKVVSGVEDKGRDYTGPAGLRLVADAGSLAKQAHQSEFDDAFRKAAVNVVGDLFGLPAAQINRTITGTQALAEGKTENPAAVAFGFQEKR